jgi:hypothetical protein
MKILSVTPRAFRVGRRVLEMSYVPREGETMLFADDAESYEINHVTHAPGSPKWDVYVILKVKQ